MPLWRYQKRVEARATAAIECRLKGLHLLNELRLRSVSIVSREQLGTNPELLAERLRQQYALRLAEIDPFITEARTAHIRAATLFRQGSEDMSALEELMSLCSKGVHWAATSTCFLDLAKGLGNDLGHGLIAASEPSLRQALEAHKVRWDDLFGAAARYEEATDQLSRAAAELRHVPDVGQRG